MKSGVADAALAPMLPLVEGHLAAQPERSDVVHDLLAHMVSTEAMFQGS
jgi:hypothetical protein